MNNDSTSIEIIKSSLSNLILLTLLIKSKESLSVYLNFRQSNVISIDAISTCIRVDMFL